MYNFGLQGFRLEELQVFRGFLLGVQAWVKAGGVVLRDGLAVGTTTLSCRVSRASFFREKLA